MQCFLSDYMGHEICGGIMDNLKVAISFSKAKESLFGCQREKFKEKHNCGLDAEEEGIGCCIEFEFLFNLPSSQF